ncbi:hypothetical protein M409DRAFT_37141 [Zasmidium cellare ATCC 36951]|uniref:Uncharacterized protein n=1 Tax=Zasmidium cellare ATCC 36951 TaxID=1080233 RepID=A0A6A6CCS2_ZASCE|nr:uncharacterized protein M409DRAFT_37141 [Zasmidium cellare ATCC 36951]KAF2163978.1 hypothetical protein M409DRAFT_37141 [Zasmidium cellare ATCC 36951]
MSAMRALKRRRLDDQEDLNKSSPGNSTTRAPSTPATEKRNGRLTQSSPAGNGNRIAKSSTSSSRNLWEEAKAKALADKQQSRRSVSRRDVDVYDDIEGANAGSQQARPSKHGPGLPKATKEEENASPKKTLDPLRNQKAQQSAAASPKKSGTSLGFFKQFHGPKAETTTANTGAKGNAGPVSDNKNKGEAMPEGTAKNWFYGKPKKTFEDEIRELEESARKNAADDESEDELATADVSRRSSARQPSQRSSVEQTKQIREPAPSPSTRTSKPPDRKKVQQAKPLVLEDILDGGSDSEMSGMEVPESEEEKPAKALERPASVRSSRQPASKKVTPRVSKVAGSKALKTFEEEHLKCVQRIVLEKLLRKRAIPLTNLDAEHAKVNTVIHQTITAGESNSMLLIGARGSGKTTLIDQILREESSKHPDDFHAVRLNGFIHTDDKIALREIWRQLGKEMDLEEEESTSKNYADTMSKLLALLSHPAEQETEEPGQITKSVIFILDEFELFASHPRQTLLYNLFDIAQSRKAPIAVLGLTTRIDVAESLEKRVKSRFSHRYVHLGWPKSFQAFEQICTAALSITSKELSLDEKTSLSKSTTSQESMSGEPMVLLLWNTLADDILKSKPCNDFLRRLYFTTKSVPDFLASLTIAVANMPIDSTTTIPILLDHFSSALSHPPLQPPDSKLSLLHSFSTIQLALLICAARLTNIYGTEVITFALAYEEYRNLAAKAKLQASAAGAIAQGAGNRVWGKAVARGAWEELVECGMVLEDGRAGGTARVDVGLEEIGMSGVELGQWGRWCKEI